MRIDYQGQSYEFDMADITVKQAIKIEKHLGCPVGEFGSRLDPSDGKSPDMLAIQCLGWLILHGGQGVPIEDTDFSVQALTAAIADALMGEEAEQAAAAAAGARLVPTMAADPSANGVAPDVPVTVP